MIPEKRSTDRIVFAESADVRAMLERLPEVQRILFSTGLPRNFLGPLYSAAEKLAIVDVPPLGRLIRFGNSSHFSDGLFINPGTGEIVDVAQGQVRSFVNSSLEQFGQTVSAIVVRFPFYSRDAEYAVNDEAVAAAVLDLSAIIDRIDPPAMIKDRFWSTFVDDVAIGDYATEDVIGRHIG
jgi:hypothetical protein